MKILGHSGIKARTEPISIGKSSDDDTALKLVLKAPRLSAITDLEDSLTPPPGPDEPKAPATGEVARTPRGEILKDEFSRPVVARNYNDPAYAKQIKEYGLLMVDYKKVASRYQRAVSTGMLLACLGDQLETAAKLSDYAEWTGEGPRPEPKKGELVDYYDKVWEEFETAGIDLVVLNRLMDSAVRLVGVHGDEFDDAREALGSSSGN